MNMASAAFMLVLGALTVIGWQQVETAQRERTAMRTQMESVTHIENALQEWVRDTRQNTDAQGFTVPTLAEFADFTNEYLPVDALTGAGLAVTAAGANAFVVDNLQLGPVDRIGVRWPGGSAPAPEVEMRLLGGWFDEEVAYFQGVLPHAGFECSSPIPTDCATGSTAVPTAYLTPGGVTRAITLSLRHPGSSHIVSNVARRFMTTDPLGGDVEGMLTPITYEPRAFVTSGDPCGDDGAQAVNANGLPMMCFDIDNDGDREWMPNIATNIYCRDASLLPTNAAYTTNMRGAVPVIEAAPLAPVTTTPLQVTVRGTDVGGTVICPIGFAHVGGTLDLCTQTR